MNIKIIKLLVLVPYMYFKANPLLNDDTTENREEGRKKVDTYLLIWSRWLTLTKVLEMWKRRQSLIFYFFYDEEQAVNEHLGLNFNHHWYFAHRNILFLSPQLILFQKSIERIFFKLFTRLPVVVNWKNKIDKVRFHVSLLFYDLFWIHGLIDPNNVAN